MNLSKSIPSIIGFLIIALVSALTFAANFDKSENVYDCLSKAQVVLAQERSLSGVSLVCNIDILQSNLDKQRSGR